LSYIKRAFFFYKKIMNFTRVLIIADVREVVDELRDFFESHGYETEVALNAKVSLAILGERRMDLAIIGFQVQDTPGTEVLAQARAIDPFLPAIIIQGNNSKRIQSMIKKAGAQAYIPKPIEWDTFLLEVKKVLASCASKVA
jgi:DNA-binding NtrC family response regulator